jgi:hypothetical protein
VQCVASDLEFLTGAASNDYSYDASPLRLVSVVPSVREAIDKLQIWPALRKANEPSVYIYGIEHVDEPTNGIANPIYRNGSDRSRR